MTETHVLLELEHVAKRYEAPGRVPTDALRDVSLRVRAGESLAIIGPSGSGKSTLLNLAGALDRPTAGIVRLEGRDLAALNDRQLAELRSRRIGLVFQQHHLLGQCTVLENVLLPALAARGGGDQARTRATELLGRVGLADRAGHFPGELSGGESQRAAVVRALINSPALVLADEPTGSLDETASTGLAELLVELNRRQQTTLIVVTHSPDLADRMDRKLALRDGRLVPGEPRP